jgi:hypothetical protein
VLRFEEQFFGEDWVSGIGHPSTHALSETPGPWCGHHPSWGISVLSPRGGEADTALMPSV